MCLHKLLIYITDKDLKIFSKTLGSYIAQALIAESNKQLYGALARFEFVFNFQYPYIRLIISQVNKLRLCI